MQMNMKVKVLQASRYDVDGSKGGALWVVNETSPENENRVGLDIMKMSAPYDLLDKLRGMLPCDCDVIAVPVQMSGNKMGFQAVDCKPLPKNTNPTNPKAA